MGVESNGRARGQKHARQWGRKGESASLAGRVGFKGLADTDSAPVVY